VDHTTQAGTILYQENRLWAKEISMILLSVILALLALSPVLLQFLKPWNVALRSPDTIFAIMAILSTSSEVKESLGGTGSSRISAIHAKLRQRSFKSRSRLNSDNAPGFHVDELPNNELGPETKSKAKKTASFIKTPASLQHLWKCSNTGLQPGDSASLKFFNRF